MPWRAEPGQIADPYRVWLSEIMLQQTTVAAVGPYFERFIDRFPTVEALASAATGDVMEAWAGLGYYARARNLHRCAQLVAEIGFFPRDLAQLRALPGIGVYTAAAIGSIAFEIPVVPVDGNVERVVSRVFRIDQPLPSAKAAIASAAAMLGKDKHAVARPGDFTQALFDLGATVCTPRAPRCMVCPWHGACDGRALDDPERLPVKAPRKVRPMRLGVHFWLEDAAGNVLLRRRPPSGLLGGMLELPGTHWREAAWSLEDALIEAPQAADWVHAGQAHHGFTHFELTLDVFMGRVEKIECSGLCLPLVELSGAALPRVMRRCVDAVLSKRQA